MEARASLPAVPSQDTVRDLVRAGFDSLKQNYTNENLRDVCINVRWDIEALLNMPPEERRTFQPDIINQLILHHCTKAQLGLVSKLTISQLDYLADTSINVLPHNEATLDLIRRIYIRTEISDSTFATLLKKSNRVATDEFGRGGLHERWNPKPMETEFQRRIIEERRKNGESYLEPDPPDRYFRRLLIDKTPSTGDVVVLATPDERNLCIVRLPPKDETREQYRAANHTYFSRAEWPSYSNKNKLFEMCGDLMEISLITCQDKGMFEEMLHKACEYAQEKDRGVKGAYLEHFGYIRSIYPVADDRFCSEVENSASAGSFKRVGFTRCCTRDIDFVFRQIDPRDCPEESRHLLKADNMIGAEIYWTVRAAEIEQLLHSLNNFLHKNRLAVTLYKNFYRPHPYPIS